MPTPSVDAADQLYHQLQLALGASFGLERELGGGGISRVFVADEPRLLAAAHPGGSPWRRRLWGAGIHPRDGVAAR